MDHGYNGWTESELREEYFTLERKLSNLWNPHHDDSFKRDRFDLDAEYVSRLVTVKQALAQLWVKTGQIIVV